MSTTSVPFGGTTMPPSHAEYTVSVVKVHENVFFSASRVALPSTRMERPSFWSRAASSAAMSPARTTSPSAAGPISKSNDSQSRALRYSAAR